MIDRQLFDEYRDALGANADLASAAVWELVRRMDGVPERDRDDALLVGYRSVVSTYGALAAQIALEFYNEARAAYAPKDPYEADAYPADDSNLIPYDVADALAKHGWDMSRLAASLSGTATQRTMEHADQTLLSNAKRDPAHPKWALVPRAGACDWCIMLGSRGFCYNEKATAVAARHDNCKCTPVVDFDAGNPSLDGYDSDELYRYYSDNLKAKWSKRTGGRSPGGAGGTVDGWETPEKIISNIEGARSADDLVRMDETAVRAVRAWARNDAEFDVAFGRVRSAAQRRMKQLRG